MTVLSMSLAAIWNPAFAQAEGSAASPTAVKKAENGIETVVVTAQKRSQNIKEVPVAITVVSAAQLERAGVKDIGDLAKTAAALEFGDQNSTSGAGGSASIRGIGTAVMTISAEGSVGVVVDGVPQGATASGLMLDLARVEVLRGPQGTLFGKNASAGVLNMSTQAPIIGDSSGSVSLEYKGQYGAAVRATANIPVNDISALRIAGSAERTEGVYHNVYKDKDSVTDNGGVRLRYLLKPNSDLAINLIGEASNTRSDNAVFFAPAVANVTNTAGNHAPLAEFAACGVTVSKTNNEVCSDGAEISRAKVRGVSGQVDWTLANGSTLTSITAYRKRDVGPNDVTIDMSRGYDKVNNKIPAQLAKQFSQEVRIASPAKQKIEYVVGAFYADSSTDKRTITGVTPNPALPAAVPRSIVSDTVESADMTTKALFGQTTFRLTDATSLITGLRYTRDTVSSDYVQSETVTFQNFTVPTSVTSARGSAQETNISGKLGLQHTLSRNANVYATISRGYKGPQIDNESPVSAATTAGSYNGNLVKPELPTSVEVGTKLSLLDRRLDVDLAAFHTKIKDFQEQNCTLTAVGALSCIPLNVPSVTSKGIEADIRARPVPELQLGMSLAVILDTAYPAGFTFDGYNVGGQRLLYSPKNKATFSADYTWTLPGDYELKLGGDMVYKSRVRYCNSTDINCSFGGHNVSSLRLNLRSPDDVWGVGVYARNLSDKRVPNAIIYPLPGKGAGSGFAYGLGENSFRRFGVTLDYRF
jgi:iron complex outermembrane receptor protein